MTTMDTTLDILLLRLDRRDKYFSGPLFRARVPALIEYVWSIPGNFFGVPLFALLVAPNILAVLTDGSKDNTHATVVTSILTVAVVLLWYQVLQGNSNAIRIFYGPIVGALSPIVGMIFLSLLHSDNAQQAGYFQIAAWCISVTPIGILKPLIKRPRPCCSVGSESHNDTSTTCKKHLTMLPKLFERDGRASFPSGDTAGAVAIMYPFFNMDNDNYYYFGMTCITLSVLGRMYWKAHHLLDVIIGVIIAHACCVGLQHYHNDCRADLWVAASSFGVLVTSVIISRMYHKVVIFKAGTISTSDDNNNGIIESSTKTSNNKKKKR